MTSQQKASGSMKNVSKVPDEGTYELVSMTDSSVLAETITTILKTCLNFTDGYTENVIRPGLTLPDLRLFRDKDIETKDEYYTYNFTKHAAVPLRLKYCNTETARLFRAIGALFEYHYSKGSWENAFTISVRFGVVTVKPLQGPKRPVLHKYRISSSATEKTLPTEENLLGTTLAEIDTTSEKWVQFKLVAERTEDTLLDKVMLVFVVAAGALLHDCIYTIEDAHALPAMRIRASCTETGIETFLRVKNPSGRYLPYEFDDTKSNRLKQMLVRNCIQTICEHYCPDRVFESMQLRIFVGYDNCVRVVTYKDVTVGEFKMIPTTDTENTQTNKEEELMSGHLKDKEWNERMLSASNTVLDACLEASRRNLTGYATSGIKCQKGDRLNLTIGAWIPPTIPGFIVVAPPSDEVRLVLQWTLYRQNSVIPDSNCAPLTEVADMSINTNRHMCVALNTLNSAYRAAHLVSISFYHGERRGILKFSDGTLIKFSAEADDAADTPDSTESIADLELEQAVFRDNVKTVLTHMVKELNITPDAIESDTPGTYLTLRFNPYGRSGQIADSLATICLVGFSYMSDGELISSKSDISVLGVTNPNTLALAYAGIAAHIHDTGYMHIQLMQDGEVILSTDSGARHVVETPTTDGIVKYIDAICRETSERVVEDDNSTIVLENMKKFISHMRPYLWGIHRNGHSAEIRLVKNVSPYGRFVSTKWGYPSQPDMDKFSHDLGMDLENNPVDFITAEFALLEALNSDVIRIVVSPSCVCELHRESDRTVSPVAYRVDLSKSDQSQQCQKIVEPIKVGGLPDIAFIKPQDRRPPRLVRVIVQEHGYLDDRIYDEVVPASIMYATPNADGTVDMQFTGYGTSGGLIRHHVRLPNNEMWSVHIQPPVVQW